MVLVSPMIGIGRLARFSRLMPLLGGIPYFEKSRWLDVQPEFNPFKYNSFPVNGVRQSWLLTGHRAGAAAAAARDRPQRPAAADPGVPVGARRHGEHARRGAPAVRPAARERQRTGAVRHQPAGAVIGPVLRPPSPLRSRGAAAGPPAPDDGDHACRRGSTRTRRSSRSHETGAVPDARVPTGTAAIRQTSFRCRTWPLPFPVKRRALRPRARPGRGFGVQLGALALRGERRTLVLSQDSLNRLSYNPFHEYMTARIAAAIDAPAAP